MRIKLLPKFRSQNIFFLLVFFAFFCVSNIIVFLSINSIKFNVEIISLSFFLFLLITFVIITEHNKFSVLVFFSLLFYGYVFSGFYFSYYENINNAKFFNFHGGFSTDDIKYSLLKVLIGYIFFVVGYKCSLLIKVKKINLDINNDFSSSTLTKMFVLFLFSISFCYWLYLSFVLANGPYGLLKNMGQYHLLLEGKHVSTAPYILAYISTSLLYLINMGEGKKINLLLKIMIVLSFIMYVSTGRLAGAVIYLLTFLLMYLIYNRCRLNFLIFFTCTLFVFLLGGLYFYRLYSNLSYLGLGFDNDIVGLVGEHFFGMTNFGDLQSIAFSSQYPNDLDYLYGSSLLDFLDYWAGKLAGIDVYITSIGTRLTNYYFSDYDSGSPAPGIISEMIINFGYIGLTVVMFLLGLSCGVLYKSIYISNNIFNVYVLANFLVFILLLTKVDSTHLNSFIWAIVPFYILTVLLRCKDYIYFRFHNRSSLAV